MSAQEFWGLLGAGLPVGLFMIAVLYGQDRKSIREKVRHWCLWFGCLSFAFLGVAVLLGFDLVPTKGILGMAFIGLPALVAGLLLFLFDRVFANARRTSHEGSKEH